MKQALFLFFFSVLLTVEDIETSLIGNNCSIINVCFFPMGCKIHMS